MNDSLKIMSQMSYRKEYAFGANYNMARNINVATCIQEGCTHEKQRGGWNNVKLDEGMMECLSEIVDENCVLTMH